MFNTTLSDCTIEDFRAVIVDVVNSTIAEHSGSYKGKHYIYGISGLADFLHCSTPTAQRLKNSGKIPYSQVGRKLVFDAEAVLSAIGRPSVGNISPEKETV